MSLAALVLVCLLLGEQGHGFQRGLGGYSRTGAAGRGGVERSVKKIEDEFSSSFKGSKSGSAALKKQKGGDWREKQRQKELGEKASPSSNESTSVTASADVESASLSEPPADADADVPGEPILEVEPIMASAEETASTLLFMESMAPGSTSTTGGGEGGGGLFSSGDESSTKVRIKERREFERQREAAAAASAAGKSLSPLLDGVLRVPKKNPLAGGVLPPEIVFFGEPRRPPPVSAAANMKYQSTLLFWARHGNVMPRDSEERMRLVFPKGKLEKDSARHRLPEGDALNFEVIFSAWLAVMDDLEESKHFIASNLDLVSPQVFMRALTVKKLAVQSRGDVEGMTYFKDIRSKYLLACDQLFFPINIERLKAETRCMTYLARDELRGYATQWDNVEATLHMMGLLAARMHWDKKARLKLEAIQESLSNTMEFMVPSQFESAMKAQFKKPALTAQTYTNASINIQENMPELYAKVAPEVKVLHESYFMMKEGQYGAVRSNIINVICPREGITLDELKFRMRVFEATITNIQGNDYIKMRQLCSEIYVILGSSAKELYAQHKWYTEFLKPGYGFETYEPDKRSFMVETDQRQRDTGNAFSNFWIRTLNMPTLYTQAFSGARKKGAEVGNWLLLDDVYKPKPQVRGDEERLEAFRIAYTRQMKLRKEAEAKLDRVVIDRMAEHDRVLGGGTRLVLDYDAETEAEPGAGAE